MKQQNRLMVEMACTTAKNTKSRGVVIYADLIEDYENLAKIGQEKQVDLILAIKDETSFQEALSIFDKVLRIPDLPLGRINQIKMAIIQALSKGLVQKGDKWICLSGMPQSKALDNLLILEFGRWHRHHRLVVGHKFSVGVADDDGVIHGAAIVGRPVARHLDNGFTLELTRCVTDGTKNAASMLYGATRRACFALGYQRLVTYTLKSEPGTSLRAAGWKVMAESAGGSWTCQSRPRVDRHPLEPKLRWESIA